MVWNKLNIFNILIGVLIGILIMAIIDGHTGTKEVIINPDTTYNKIKLDSIKVQVGEHDTTIYKLNIKLKDDVQKSYQLNDSAAVELFKQLATSTNAAK